MSLIRYVLRFKFACTSRKAATAMIEDELAKTLAVVERLGPAACQNSAQVPKMPGVDEDMREWSMFQILEHNTIVNHRFKEAVLNLTTGCPPSDPNFDAKRDVMPAPNSGPDQVEAFRESVETYLAAILGIKNFRDTETRPHPLFGPFNAHRWHCMFGFHLGLHRRQAEALEKVLGKSE